MNIIVEFKEDFATKKKGDVMELEGQSATTLIKDGVAKKRERKPAVKKTKKAE